MRFLAIFAAAVVLTPLAALAQTDREDVDRAACAELVKSFSLIETTADSTIEDIDAGCRVTNVFAGTSSYNRYRIGSATLTAPDLFTRDLKDALPSELDLAITGFQIAPDTGSLLNNYIIENQSEPLNIHLSYRWDKAAQTAELTDLSVTSPGYGSFRIEGRLSEIDLDRFVDAAADFPGAIDAVTVEIVNARFFSAMTVPALLGLLPYDSDPRPLVADYKKAAIAFIAALPTDNMADESKAALGALVESFPRMEGDYVVQMRADPPLALTTLTGGNPAEITGLIARMQISAEHTPAVQP
ncbi:hypothetical protein WH87_15020 [Devosia epidermidihirudinis]|uniref:Uncharacterized protein n=1 Tax=Devosia epidermidihirudinis TaxID=1293439 RepID=A0A0F5Q783_9HYPH|nr:hypothetical protein [Devosia epidermidihirudinis]KKC35879.1 hypothetical protein WH87_15020 [Devosia epidermidihirudinis]